MLEEAVASVQTQTHTAWELITLVDDLYEGQSTTINRIAAACSGDWVFPFDDDDLLFRGCLKELVAGSDGADVVFAPPDVEGEDPQQFRGQPPMIPTPALIRRDLWNALGGYNRQRFEQEDRDLFERLMAAGAKFRRVDEVLWLYRFHPGVAGGNKSRGYVPGTWKGE